MAGFAVQKNMSVFTIHSPDGPKIPLVFDSPHSGCVYPPDFDFTCDPSLLLWGEDKYIDEIYSAAPSVGASLLCAHFPRTYIDANRALSEMDEELLAEPWPDEIVSTPRSRAGIGLIRRLMTPTTPLYDRKLTVSEVKDRIDRYYHPYYTALKKLLDTAHAAFGAVYHINCHAMPAQNNFASYIGRHTDFVLGDRDGTSCGNDFVHHVRDVLKDMGYSVAINDPYKGVELVRKYSDPASERHSLQIEICKSLYMNETTGEKTRGFPTLKENIDRLVADCAAFVMDKIQ